MSRQTAVTSIPLEEDMVTFIKAYRMFQIFSVPLNDKVNSPKKLNNKFLVTLDSHTVLN